MALDLINLMSTTAALIGRNNTSTSSYNLKSGLNVGAQKIFTGARGLHEKMPVSFDVYPVIFVELGSKTESYNRMGSSGKRDVTIEADIVAVTQYGIGAGDENVGRQLADAECIKLTQNVEELIRNKIDLSLTCSHCLIRNTQYAIGVGGEQTYNAVGIINLEIVKIGA